MASKNKPSNKNKHNQWGSVNSMTTPYCGFLADRSIADACEQAVNNQAINHPQLLVDML